MAAWIDAAARARVSALEAEVKALKRRLSDAAAEHGGRLDGLEEGFRERIGGLEVGLAQVQANLEAAGLSAPAPEDRA